MKTATLPQRLLAQRAEWLRRERRYDMLATVLLCSAVGLVCWAMPLTA